MKCYPWLRPYLYQLISNYQAKLGHHALLIYSLTGMGDEALIYAITCFLLCQEKSKKYNNCGKCQSCQLMQSNTHPDYYILTPEKCKNILSIEEIREIKENLYEHAKLGNSKVVWLSDINFLAENTISTLLKLLEEPPSKTWFFISCYEPNCLVTALRSYCRVQRLSVPQESLALAWLKRKITTSHKTAITALRLCGGAPVAALKMLDPTIHSQRKHLYKSIKYSVDNNDWLSLLNILNCDQASKLLHWIVSLLLDALKMQNNAITLIDNVDNSALVNTLAHRISSAILLTVINDICNCRKQILNIIGVDRELLLINLLLCIEYYLQSNIISPISSLMQEEDYVFDRFTLSSK